MIKGYQRILIVGATSSIAEHCARLWVAQPNVSFVFIVRDKKKANDIASDLMVRNLSAKFETLEIDFLDPKQISTVVDQIFKTAPVDLAFIAQGILSNQKECQKDLVANRNSLNVNAISPVLFAEKIIGHMEQINYGTLALIGSVAGDRGRKSNYVYGAAKGLITCYAQGLQHRLARSAVKVILIKPGPTATPMTFHIKGVKMSSVETVAKAIVKGIRNEKSVIYAPSKWGLIMLVIRHLPVFIFNRIDI
jgi:decaprenylphospho-beta-D-erythro-pentofuranosid-2-ulose 2-reductase